MGSCTDTCGWDRPPVCGIDHLYACPLGRLLGWPQYIDGAHVHLNSAAQRVPSRVAEATSSSSAEV